MPEQDTYNRLQGVKNTENQKPFLRTHCPSVNAHRTFDPEIAGEPFDLGRTEEGLER